MRLVGDDREPFPFEPLFFRISAMAKGKVWMVTTMISLPSSSALASSPDLDLMSPDLATSAWSMATTMPASLSICLMASRSWASRTLRSVTTITESNTLVLSTCSRAIRCAVQAMESVLPDPAECWIR